MKNYTVIHNIYILVLKINAVILTNSVYSCFFLLLQMLVGLTIMMQQNVKSRESERGNWDYQISRPHVCRYLSV